MFVVIVGKCSVLRWINIVLILSTSYLKCLSDSYVASLFQFY